MSTPAAEATQAARSASRRAADSPFIPVVLLLAGGYLAWFGIHYWRDKTTIWPTDPIKDVLTGKGIPARDREQTIAEDIGGAAAIAASGPGGPVSPAGIGGQELAADEQKYVGVVPYLWSGATPKGWDCSGMQNWCLCHDMGLGIPGFKGGSFDGSEHGPVVSDYLTWGGATTVAGKPQPGDLLLWGPGQDPDFASTGGHMGMAISATEFVSAENPDNGTAKATIKGFFAVDPIIRRIKETGELASTSGGSVRANQNLARLLAQPYGWSSGTQWTDLVKLWQQESGWNVHETNPGSGAYGIPQALPGDKMRSAGKNWKSSARTQIAWGLGYIRDRYGDPSAAWAHEEAKGWY